MDVASEWPTAPVPEVQMPQSITAPVSPVSASPGAFPGAFNVPPRKNIWTPDWVLESVLGAICASETGQRVCILITGPHGNGKSHLAQQIAALKQAPYLEWSCQRMAEPSDFFVVTKAEHGSTVDHATDLYRACKTPNAVIHLQEPNRTISPKAINTIIDLTDPTAGYSTTVWELGEKLTLAEGIIMIASINEGYQFTGTDAMDRALKSRFMGLDMVLPPEDVIFALLSSNNGATQANSTMANIKDKVANQRAANSTNINQDTLRGLAQWPRLVAERNLDPNIGVREVKKVCEYLSWGLSLAVACRVAVRAICEKEEQLTALLQMAQQAVQIRLSWDNWVSW